MTVNDWLTRTTKDLTAAGIPTARLDATVLLCDELHKNSAQLLAEPGLSLTSEQQQRLDEHVTRRKTHEPLAYIRQKCEFYGREFIISDAVLTPRPETEAIIELLKQLPPAAQQVVVDVGTGSGAIAITIACELSVVQVMATDIDQACLDIARKNCIKHRATVQLIKTNLAEDVKLPPNATILANLPYVPNSHAINQAATHEPALAIFGGEDGLDLYRTLFAQLQNMDHRGYVLTEALPSQHEALSLVAKQYGYSNPDSDDFIQVFYKD